MKLVTAPESYDFETPHEYSVFLAGAIDMGVAVDWQAWVIERLKDVDGLTLINPRRRVFTSETLDEQIRWELNALDQCSAIFLWFPVNAKAPISFLEAGLYWNSGKLVIGAEEGFYRRRNLELTGDYYGLYICKTLDEMIDGLMLDFRY